MAESASDPFQTTPVRPGDFARILLAASGSPPRARARDQQADLTGEALRQRVLDRLIALDPAPEDFDVALLTIIIEFGQPDGPTRGVCTAIHQEWEMVRVQPGYLTFLVGQAIQPESKRSRRLPEAR